MRNEQLITDLQALYQLFSKPGIWVQGKYMTRKFVGDVMCDCYCLSGGIRHIIPAVPNFHSRYTAVSHAICEQLPEVGGWEAGELSDGHIITWNDNVSRKELDVLVVIQKALTHAQEA